MLFRFIQDADFAKEHCEDMGNSVSFSIVFFFIFISHGLLISILHIYGIVNAAGYPTSQWFFYCRMCYCQTGKNGVLKKNQKFTCTRALKERENTSRIIKIIYWVRPPEGPKIETIFRNLQSEFLFGWISSLSLFFFWEHIYINLYLWVCKLTRYWLYFISLCINWYQKCWRCIFLQHSSTSTSSLVLSSDCTLSKFGRGKKEAILKKALNNLWLPY